MATNVSRNLFRFFQLKTVEEEEKNMRGRMHGHAKDTERSRWKCGSEMNLVGVVRYYESYAANVLKAGTWNKLKQPRTPRKLRNIGTPGSCLTWWLVVIGY